MVVKLSEFERDAGKYLRQVAAGESLVVIDNDKPIAEIKPLSGSVMSPRPIGLAAGEFTVPDDFDAPLPPEIIDDFYK